MRTNLILLLLVFVSVCSLLPANIIEVKQDGSGDFTTIQAGLNASADSDTILVYPGTFIENVDFLGKSITLASTYIFNFDDTVIYETIIDGNQASRCIKIRDCANASVIGFTIQNGCIVVQDGDNSGGGIRVRDSNAQIVKIL